ASYEARAFGIRSAMGGRRARELCPHAIVVKPQWEAYLEASRAVTEIFEETAPLVEPLSIDEAFLDVRGLERISGTPPRIAARLRREVRGRRPADLGRRGPEQEPGQDGQRRGQARRPARGRSRPRGRVPGPAPGRAAVGRRAGDHGQAARERPHPRAPARRARAGDAGRAARAGARPARPRARPPARPAAGAAGRRTRLVRRAERARAGAEVARGDRCGAAGARRPGHATHAREGAGRAHDRAAAALRRLLTRDPFADAAAVDGGHAHGAEGGARSARRLAPDDRTARPDPRRHHGREPRSARARHPARAAARWAQPGRARRRGGRDPHPHRAQGGDPGDAAAPGDGPLPLALPGRGSRAVSARLSSPRWPATRTAWAPTSTGTTSSWERTSSAPTACRSSSPIRRAGASRPSAPTPTRSAPPRSPSTSTRRT